MAVLAALKRPEGVAVDALGNVYISDTQNNRIRRVAPSGIITTVAGNGSKGYNGDGVKAIKARLNLPKYLVVSSTGSIYFADCYNKRVRVVNTLGIINTVAGNGTAGYSGDGGAATSAMLNYPSGVALDSSGNIYIADWYNHRIRMVNASGTISTVAGRGIAGYSGDGGPAASATLNYPYGVAVDGAGNVFLSDNKNSRVRFMEGPAYTLPLTSIISPNNGTTVSEGSSIITGTADSPDGISFVEVSTDGGSTWGTANGSSTWNYRWAPSGLGNRIIASRATDSMGKVGNVASAVMVTTVADTTTPIVINSLVSNVASPATAGTSVSWTASASGGSGNLQYQFLRMGPDTGGAYVVAQNYGSSATWTWATTSAMAGTNTIMLNVRNADGSGTVSKSVAFTVQVVAALVINSFTPSPATATAGTSVVWTAAVSGGSGSGYQYQFTRIGPDTGGTSVVAKAYSTSNSWSWATTAAMVGSNTVAVAVKDSAGATATKSAVYTLAAASTSTLVGYWKFDETSGTTATDSSGLGDNGALTGATRVSGITGNAVSLDGTTAYVLAPGASSLKPVSTVSVAAWVKPTTAPASGGEVVSMGDNYVLRVLSDGNVMFFFYNGTTWITLQTTGVNVLDGNWHHLAGVKSASQMVVYVDGVSKASSAASGTIPYSLGTNLYIGMHGNGSTSHNFNGIIDEVRVYNVDLNATQVQGIFTSTPVPAPAPLPISVSSLTPSPATATAGTTVTWTSTASGGSGGYQYQFSRKGPDTGGTSVVVKAYSTSNTWAWATTSAMVGSNTVTVTVKDSSGATGTSSVVYTLSSTSTAGNSYYMSTTGSDSNTGSITSPWKTIASASAKLKPGDTLYVRGGTYTGQGGYIWNSVSGTSTAPITLKAYPGETPVFDGGWTLGEWVVLTNSVGWIVIDGITAQHFDDEYGDGTILLINGANNITIQNCKLIDNGKNTAQDHAIYLGASGVANITIRNNLIQHAAAGGIQSWHGPNANGVLIYNNIITGCHWGIIFADNTQNIEIYNNTIDKNDIGIDFSYTGDSYTSSDPLAGVKNVTMKDNIISNSASYGMKVGSCNVNDIIGDNNLWYNNAVTVLWNTSNNTLAQYQANTVNDRHSVGADPSYVSASTGNYHLNSTSPAIDKGTTLSKVPNDKDNTARPKGVAYDMGAYESY